MPVTSEPSPGQNWSPSYIGSPRYMENERLEKEEHHRIQRDINKNFDDLKKRVFERRQAEAKAMYSESSEAMPKGSDSSTQPKAMPKASSSAGDVAGGVHGKAGTPVKAMPNPYHSLEYSPKFICGNSVSDESECEVLACPGPRCEQPYRSFIAALKRQRKMRPLH